MILFSGSENFEAAVKQRKPQESLSWAVNKKPASNHCHSPNIKPVKPNEPHDDLKN